MNSLDLSASTTPEKFLEHFNLKEDLIFPGIKYNWDLQEQLPQPLPLLLLQP